jgi:MFS family permease
MPSFVKQVGHKTALGPMLTATDISLMTAVPTAGGLFGLLITSVFGDKYGRKKTIILGAIINMIGAVIQTAAINLPMIVVGRLFACMLSLHIYSILLTDNYTRQPSPYLFL